MTSRADRMYGPTIQFLLAGGGRDTIFTVLRVVLLVGCALGLGIGLAYADVYAWTDNDGVTHFTNMKPSGGPWKKVLDSAAPAGSKASAQRGGCPRCDKGTPADTSPERFHRYDPDNVEASQLVKIPLP